MRDVLLVVNEGQTIATVDGHAVPIQVPVERPYTGTEKACDIIKGVYMCISFSLVISLLVWTGIDTHG